MRSVKNRSALIKVVIDGDDGRMDLTKAAAVVEAVTIDADGVPQVTFKTLSTPQGRIVELLLSDEKNVVYVATFGHGSVEGKDQVVQDDYSLNHLGFIMPQMKGFTSGRVPD
jgi:hypothetical protein